MKKLFVILLAVLMMVTTLSGCTKEEPKPDPVVVTPITLQDVKAMIEKMDSTVKEYEGGSYTFASSNTQNDKNESKVVFAGENTDWKYDATYNIKCEFVNGAWNMTNFELVDSKKAAKKQDIDPNPPVPTPGPVESPSNTGSETGGSNTNEGPNGTSEDDPTKYLTMIEKHYTDGKYDEARISNVEIKGDRIVCDVEAEETWKFIADVDYLHVEALIENGGVRITSEELKKQATISNFEGKYYQVNYTGVDADKRTPYIEFTRDWQYKMYVNTTDFSKYLVSEGSYRISNDKITMKVPKGWKYVGENWYIGGGSEIGWVPHDSLLKAIDFKITAISRNEVVIGEGIGTSVAGAHFKK